MGEFLVATLLGSATQPSRARIASSSRRYTAVLKLIVHARSHVVLRRVGGLESEDLLEGGSRDLGAQVRLHVPLERVEILEDDVDLVRPLSLAHGALRLHVAGKRCQLGLELLEDRVSLGRVGLVANVRARAAKPRSAEAEIYLVREN